MHNRAHILRNTIAIALATGVSRILGFVRELLMVRYLGVGPAADAFLTALRLPNSLRKIFAEGALTAALVPSLVAITEQRGKVAAARVITAVFVVMAIVVSGVALCIAYYAPTVVGFLVPGWRDPAQIALTVRLLQILIPALVLFSLMAICTGALNAAGKFGFASLSQSLQNLFMIMALAAALTYHLSLETVAVLTILGIVMLAALHMWAYARVYSLALPTRDTIADTLVISKKFFPCIITLGALELNIFIDQIFASYLPAGSVSLLYYTQAFVRLPLGVVIMAFATVLLPVLSRVAVRTPRRLPFHLYEALKLVLWVTIPSVFAMMILGYPAFSTLMVSEHFSREQAGRAARLLALFACGVPFFAANRVIVAIYHARHDTIMPTIITLATTMINTACNALLIKPFGIYGLVAATIGAEILKSALLLAGVRRFYHVVIPWDRLGRFAFRCTVLCIALASSAVLIGYSIYAFLVLRGHTLFTTRWGLWIWCVPLCGVIALIYYATRRLAGCRCFFLGD